MAQATQHHNRFHNLSHEALADAIGQADLAVKAAEKALADYKDELKRRGLSSATGEPLHRHHDPADQLTARHRGRARPPRRGSRPVRKAVDHAGDQGQAGHSLRQCGVSPQTPAFTSSWPSVPRAWAQIPDRGSHHV
jgi:hypothetical protein